MLEGTHGQGLFYAKTLKMHLATAQTLQVAGVKFVMQEFIAEAQGTDIEPLCVIGQVVASIKETI